MEGQHLLITGPSPCPPSDVVYRFLVQCPLSINMTRITEPIVGWEDGKVSAMVIIAESHISLHHQSGVTFVDVFSCMRFDVKPVKRLVESMLGLDPTKIRSRVIMRSMG